MTRRTKAQWQSIVEQYAQSTLSTRAFCEQHNIHLQTFYSRRHALGLAKPRHNKPKVTPAKPVSQFVQAQIVTPNCSIVMHTREAQLLFSSQCDPLWVAKVLKGLAA
ncbi:MAG: transposase-like protein [Paraglaciecola sp.]|jgi:transposase-like protein